MHGWLGKKRIVRQRQAAIEEISAGRAESEMALELKAKAARDKQAAANKAIRDKVREAEVKDRVVI